MVAFCTIESIIHFLTMDTSFTSLTKDTSEQPFYRRQTGIENRIIDDIVKEVVRARYIIEVE